MKPVIALVGRPNVGKSTLFNKLTRTRDALVADLPGLTRDRKYGDGVVGGYEYIVIDTGGLSGEDEELDMRMATQTMLAIEEADAVLFLVDGRGGIHPDDESIARELRRLGKNIHLVVNKIDGIGEDQASSDFFTLGFGEPFPVAAAHNRGVKSMMEEIGEKLGWQEVEEGERERDDSIRIAVVGRPNVGKSTLINRLIGEERLVAFDMPGTTRDSVFVPFEQNGKKYTMIDTAGVRRRGKVKEVVEKFSVIKTLQAVDAANVVVIVLDGREGVTEQDLSLLGYVLDAGRAIVVAVNKWDDMDTEAREKMRRELERRMAFLKFTKTHLISALFGSGVSDLMKSVNKAYKSAMVDMSTPELTRMLEYAMEQHQPPLVRGRRIKLRYAHQGGSNPPIVVIHGNQVDSIPGAYKRYLSNFYQESLHLFGTPLRIEFRGGSNPFEGKRNTLTPRQQAKRKRMMKKVKSGK
jgi:GTP-binding protein